MVKFFILMLFYNFIYADPFEENCLQCHQNKQELFLFMKHYTLKYSTEKKIKNNIFLFLKAPTQHHSVMDAFYIHKVGFKSPSLLHDTELKQAIKKYYLLYNMKQFFIQKEK